MAASDHAVTIVRHALSALEFDSPEDVANALGRITDATAGPGPRLFLVAPRSRQRTWTRGQVSAASDGSVRSVVLEFDPRNAPSVEILAAELGAPRAVPGPEGSRWAWSAEQLQAPASLLGEHGLDDQVVMMLVFVPNQDE